MLSDRSRKLLRVLFNLYRHEPFLVNCQRVSRMIGLSVAPIDTAMTELQEQQYIVTKDGFLQVAESRERNMSYR